jgi:hypothetical protein
LPSPATGERNVALGGVEVVARRATSGKVAEPLLEPEGLAEMLRCITGLAGAEVQRAELVVRPPLTGLVAGGLRRSEQGAQRANEIEPATREDEQAVERADEPELLFEPPGPVEPAEQVEQRVELTGQVSQLEELPVCRRPKEPIGLLDPVGDRRSALLELLDRRDRSRLLLVLFRERGLEFVRVLSLQLRLEPREQRASVPTSSE